jgi:hypothetical protein
MAILTISLLLSGVEQFLQNFCSAPLKKIELHLVQHMEVLQEAKAQQMYNAVFSQTGYKNNPDLQSTLGVELSAINISKWTSLIGRTGIQSFLLRLMY